MDVVTHQVLRTLLDLNRHMEELVEVHKYLLNELVQRGPDYSKEAVIILGLRLAQVEQTVATLEGLVTEERKP